MSKKEDKRREAEARNEAWRKLTPTEQLKELDKRLGVGKGASKQREKLTRKHREKDNVSKV